MMSFFREILMFPSTRRLRKTDTRVTTPGGKQYTECHTEGAAYHGKSDESETSNYYCVDHKPDLNIAEIRPGLFVGSQDVAHDQKLLEEHKITHIVNAASYVCNQFPKTITYLKLEIMDMPSADITRYFDECHDFVASARNDGGRVYIHCNAGVSRAPTLTIAYLMRSERLKFRDALQVVRDKRFFICPNEGFVQQLIAYENKLKIK